jgi:hypothetical protein
MNLMLYLIQIVTQKKRRFRYGGCRKSYNSQIQLNALEASINITSSLAAGERAELTTTYSG